MWTCTVYIDAVKQNKKTIIRIDVAVLDLHIFISLYTRFGSRWDEESFGVIGRDQIFRYILFCHDFVAMHVKSVCNHEFVMPVM